MSLSPTNQLALEPVHEFSSIDLLGAWHRRKLPGFVMIVVCLCVTVAAAVLWPPTYRSTATILIEEPDVPDDLVKSTVSTFAEERLQLIQQRVMTTQNLNDIIARFGLYADQLANSPRSQIIENMRQKITMEVISANLFGPQAQTRSSSQAPKASIAFTVSFDHADPRLAQQVASRLTDLYLAENAQSRQEKAAGTTEFLSQQSDKLYADVKSLEDQLTKFKAKYTGSLPEQLTVNLQILDQVQTQLMQNRRDVEALSQKRSYLQSQLSQLSPYMPMTSQGQPATPQAQLMALELQYVDLSAKYGPKHPTVIHLQKQIDGLKQQLGTSDEAVSSQGKLSQLQQQLAEALQRYGEKHPTVQNLRKQLADLSGELAKSPTASVITAPKGPPDNPIYIQLQSELGDASAQMQGVQAQTKALEAKVQDLQARVLQTPVIEGEYASLQQQYSAAVTRYQDFKIKQADAQVAENMEQQSKGETFSVIDAPQFPDAPVKPNRILVLMAGVVVSGLFAGSLMVGLEMMDSRIYEPKGLLSTFGEVPLVTVPYISTRQERMRARIRFLLIVLVVLGAIAGVLVFVNFAVIPLDVLVAAIINRISS